MSQNKSKRLSTFDIIEAFQLSHAVVTLHNLNVLRLLSDGHSVPLLAKKLGLEVGCLRGVLEYIAARTDLVTKIDGTFVVSGAYSKQSRYLLDLYMGAYGRNAFELQKVLTDFGSASSKVRRKQYMHAFREVADSSLGGIPEIIQQLNLNCVLDIGCGPAALLLRLAANDKSFIGWGLEISSPMCKEARLAIQRARVTKRLRIYKGNSFGLASILPVAVRAKIQAVIASHVANEMFMHGNARASRWLRSLRKALPGRVLLLSDYYGRLGCLSLVGDRETLLHDYVQLISGQGVPPYNLSAWQQIYKDASVQLVHVMEDNHTTRFVHVIKL